MIEKCYVKGIYDDIYFVQIPDYNNKYGFSLCNEKAIYPGGYDCGLLVWTTVKEDDVPNHIRDKLQFLFDK